MSNNIVVLLAVCITIQASEKTLTPRSHMRQLWRPYISKFANNEKTKDRESFYQEYKNLFKQHYPDHALVQPENEKQLRLHFYKGGMDTTQEMLLQETLATLRRLTNEWDTLDGQEKQEKEKAKKSSSCCVIS